MAKPAKGKEEIDMPMVNGKKYAYTKSGMAAAARAKSAAKKKKAPVKKRGKK